MKTRLLRSAVILAVTMLIVYGFIRESSRVYLLHHENKRLKSEISILDKENSALKRKSEMLKKDPEYFEKVVRDELGMIKVEEKVYWFNNGEETLDGGTHPRAR